jgi:hypothetical protein
LVSPGGDVDFVQIAGHLCADRRDRWKLPIWPADCLDQPSLRVRCDKNQLRRYDNRQRAKAQAPQLRPLGDAADGPSTAADDSRKFFIEGSNLAAIFEWRRYKAGPGVPDRPFPAQGLPRAGKSCVLRLLPEPAAIGDTHAE